MSDDQATETFDRDAVYRRTHAGQRELISPSGRLQPLERRFLALVTGHTPVHVLEELAGHDPQLSGAVTALCAQGLIDQEDDEPTSWFDMLGDTALPPTEPCLQ